MRWWERAVSGASKGQIISLLRRAQHTVDELAGSLGVTDNAVRAQLQSLEESRVVRVAGSRQGSGAGKPANLYEIAPEAEPLFSSAYAPVLSALIETLGAKLSARELRAVLRDTAKRLVPGVADMRQSADVRAHAAADVLTSLGAELDVEKTSEGYRLRGRACPLAAAVRADAATCQIVEELVGSISGMRAREHCVHGASPKCLIELKTK